MAKHRREVEMRALPCDLSEEEIHLKGAELARTAIQEAAAEGTLETMKADHKEAVKAQKVGLADIRGHRQRLAGEISSRSQERDVRCRWHHDLDGGYTYLVREDTGRAILREKMVDEERQLAIGEKLAAASSDQLQLWEAQLSGVKAEDEPPAEEEDSEK